MPTAVQMAMYSFDEMNDLALDDDHELSVVHEIDDVVVLLRDLVATAAEAPEAPAPAPEAHDAPPPARAPPRVPPPQGPLPPRPLLRVAPLPRPPPPPRPPPRAAPQPRPPLLSQLAPYAGPAPSAGETEARMNMLRNAIMDNEPISRDLYAFALQFATNRDHVRAAEIHVQRLSWAPE